MPAASRDLRRIGPDATERVEASVNQFAMTGRGDVVPLKGREQQWRLRVGRDWRVIFTYDRTRSVLRILRVLPRGRAYR